MTGNSIYEYIHPGDHDEMAALLTVHHKPEQVKFGGESISDVIYLLLVSAAD